MVTLVRIVVLLPHRAAQEQNAGQELAALRDAGYEVVPIPAPRPGMLGVAWLTTAGARKASRLKPDIIVARDLDALGAAMKVKKQTGAKLVYDMHEAYSYMVEDDVPKRLLPLIEKYERRILPQVDLVLASDAGRADWISRQWVKVGTGLDPAWEMRVIYNCRDPVQPYVPPPCTGRLFYGGTLHPSRFIWEMVAAMVGTDWELVIAGPNTPGSLYDWLKKNHWRNVSFQGYMTPQESLSLLQKCDVSVQMANPKSRINQLGPYNRLFDAMAVGRASIGTVGTENGNIISNCRIGLSSMYDMDAYITTVQTLLGNKKELQEMGLRAYKLCVEELNWKAQAKEMVEAFESL